MENSPLVFQRSETRGEFSLAEVFLVKILTYFLVILCFVSEKFSPAALFFEDFRVLSSIRNGRGSDESAQKVRCSILTPEALLLVDLPSPSSRRTMQKGNDHYGPLLGAAGENFELLGC